MTTVTKEKKKEIIENLRKNITKQEAMYFVNFKGIKGEDVRSLRNELRKNDSTMIVARKTLAKIAFDKEGIEFNPLSFENEVGFIFSFEDGIETAKIIKKLDKEEVISILGGIYEGDILNVDQVKSIAELPTREELLSMFVGTVAAPIGSFMRVLQGNTRGLLNILNEKAKL